jgi:hypothetical protein
LATRTLAGASLAALVLLCAPRAFAQAKTISRDATVIAIDSGDLVIDLGLAKGARDGQVVELWRPMRVKHPVTGQVITDRFRIGRVTLSQVQPTLSLARADEKMLRPPATGDLVIAPDLVPPKLEPAPTPLPAPTASTPTKAQGGVASSTPPSATPSSSGAKPNEMIVWSDPDTKELSDLFVAVTGWTPEARAQAYERFITKHPKSRYARVLTEEIAALRQPGTQKEGPAPYEFSFSPFDRLRPGQPQRVAIELDKRFLGGIVHVRHKGDVAYRSLVMEPIGEHYWAATLPGDATDEPGMQYFVEGVPKDGPSIAVVGTQVEPRDVEVEPRAFSGKKPGTLGQFNVQSEYASFNQKKRDDYLFQTEGTFGWRMRDDQVRAIRSGFGVFRGRGGSLADLDAGKPPTEVGLTYGYVEAEFGITPIYGIIVRPILGLRDKGIAGGAQGFFRVGSDLKTNLLIGGEILGTVGLRGIVQLDWRTIPRVPIVLRSEVTNQPAGLAGDVGVRTIAQAGYEIVPSLTASARVSYQGRTINHAGPGAGLGVNYQW